MKISIVICTHNRAESLHRTLKSLAQQTLPRQDFEIIVVDNASTDATQTVIESFAHLPLHSISEPTLGLSIARNTGWQAAGSSYVAFLDDDVEADPAWLKSILETFTANPTQEIVVGGQVELVLPIGRPSWLTEDLLFCLGKLDAGKNTTVLNDTSFYLPGCNIAFTKQTLADCNGFPTFLGRKGKRLLSGEEIFLQQKIKTAGGLLLYTEAAKVKHHIDKSRLTKTWFLRRIYWEGVTNMKIKKMRGYHAKPAKELMALLGQPVFSFSYVCKAPFSDICNASQQLGRLAESLWPH